MEEKFIAIYKRHYSTHNEPFDSYDDAIKMLESGSDRCELFPVCILSSLNKNILWHHEWLSIEEVHKVIWGI